MDITDKQARLQIEQAQEAAALQAKKEAILLEKERRQAEKAKESLAEFLKAIWPITNPGRPLVWGWHIDAMAEHVEALVKGQIKKLAIAVPPATTKTALIGEAWAPWEWASNPAVQFLYSSYSDKLSTGVSLKCRSIVNSPWYVRHFPHVQLTTDQNVKTWFQTNAFGHRKSLIVAHGATGEKGDRLVVDDPHDARQVHSRAHRDAVIEWYDMSFHDRLNDFATGCRLIVAQRTHRQDLIGHCVANHGYELLMIPQEFQPSRRIFTSIGWTDPRTQEGELLCPGRYSAEEVESLKKQPMYAAKHQQNPLDSDTAVFKPAYFKVRWRYSNTRHNWIVLDDGENQYEFDAAQSPMFASCDAAANANTSSDDTGLGVFSVSPRGDLVWRHLYLEKLNIPDQPKLLSKAFTRWPFSFIAIEAVGANSAMRQFAEGMGLTVLPMKDNDEKLVRAQAAIIKASQGRVWLPEDGVNVEFDTVKAIDQLVNFTGRGKREKDDVVDVLSHAVNAMPYVYQIGTGGEGAAPIVVASTTGGRFCSPNGPTEAPRFGTVKIPTPSTVTQPGSRSLPWG